MAIVPTVKKIATIQENTGQVMAPVGILGDPIAKAVGKASLSATQGIVEAGQRIQKREDLIARTEISNQYEAQELKEYTAFLSTANIRDSKSLDVYNLEQEKRLQNTLTSYSGTADQRANLESTLRGRQGAYMQQLTRKSLAAQTSFILDTAQKEIAPIVSSLTSNPTNFVAAFGQVDGIIEKFSSGLSAEAERNLKDSSYAIVMDNTVGGLLRRGKWKEANKMLEDNPLLSKFLPESKRKQYNTQISNFATEENKLQVGMQSRKAVIDELRDQGHNIDSNRALNYVVGENVAAKNLGNEINTTLRALGIDPNTATTAQRAAVSGINLPKTKEVDPNKDYRTVQTPSGPQIKLTEQGTFKRTKPYIEQAVDISGKLDTVDSLWADYLTGNELSGLGLLQTYLKMIDEGAVVRDSDIAMAERASPIYSTIATALSKYKTEGAQAVSKVVLKQAYAASVAFGQKALEQSKGFFDGYENQTGYSKGVLGLPGDTYDKIFGTVRTIPNFKVKDKTKPFPSQQNSTSAKNPKPETSTPRYEMGKDGNPKRVEG